MRIFIDADKDPGADPGYQYDADPCRSRSGFTTLRSARICPLFPDSGVQSVSELSAEMDPGIDSRFLWPNFNINKLTK